MSSTALKSKLRADAPVFYPAWISGGENTSTQVTDTPVSTNVQTIPSINESSVVFVQGTTILDERGLPITTTATPKTNTFDNNRYPNVTKEYASFLKKEAMLREEIDNKNSIIDSSNRQISKLNEEIRKLKSRLMALEADHSASTKYWEKEMSLSKERYESEISNLRQKLRNNEDHQNHTKELTEKAKKDLQTCMKPLKEIQDVLPSVMDILAKLQSPPKLENDSIPKQSNPTTRTNENPTPNKSQDTPPTDQTRKSNPSAPLRSGLDIYLEKNSGITITESIQIKYFAVRDLHVNVDLAIRIGMWSATLRNEDKLVKHFKQKDKVILIFIPFGANCISGWCQMASLPDPNKPPYSAGWKVPYKVKLGNCFKLTWIDTYGLSRKAIRNKGLSLELVDELEDGEEITPDIARKITGPL